jgi:orotate phosphoribosyltransferase
MINYDTLGFKEDRLSQLIKTLHKNNVIRFARGQNKLLQPIPYDFRIDRCCSAEHISVMGEMMADRVIEIEKYLDTEFDSIFCSLFSGVFVGVSTSMWLLNKYNRNIKLSISRRSYTQKMGEETGKETFISSIHQLKNKTLVGELGENVLVFDEMTNTGITIQELINISKFNGVTPKAVMIIADRILEPIEDGSHIRMYGDIPCYSSITHFEIVKWCEENQQIWNTLEVPMYDNQNKFGDNEFKQFECNLKEEIK